MRAALQVLNLASNCFQRLPPALSAATALSRLHLEGNPSLTLRQEDVAGILACMAALRTLSLGAAKATPGVLLHLGATLPALVLGISFADPPAEPEE